MGFSRGHNGFKWGFNWFSKGLIKKCSYGFNKVLSVFYWVLRFVLMGLSGLFRGD